MSIYKDTIYSLESKNKNMLKEIENFRKRQNDLIQNSSHSIDEVDELVKFTKERDNLNLLLGNQ